MVPDTKAVPLSMKRSNSFVAQIPLTITYGRGELLIKESRNGRDLKAGMEQYAPIAIYGIFNQFKFAYRIENESGL